MEKKKAKNKVGAVFSGGSDGKASVCNAGDPGSIPGLGRSPGEGNGSPLQHSCLENTMDGRARWATVHGVAKSQTRLNDFTSLHAEGRSALLFVPGWSQLGAGDLRFRQPGEFFKTAVLLTSLVLIISSPGLGRQAPAESPVQAVKQGG